MKIIIRCVALAGIITSERDPRGLWLRSYDPEQNNGRGAAEWTDDPADALMFSSADEAYECWASTPKNKPLRDNGQPNRPLTAYTVQIEPADNPDVSAPGLTTIEVKGDLL